MTTSLATALLFWSPSLLGGDGGSETCLLLLLRDGACGL